ncbi:MAG: alanine:cation symporter family protein [Bacilli bacterium]|nr:alanine:cation symporter family protein [Bacilli bacterium]
MLFFMLLFLFCAVINTIYLKFPQFKIFKNIKKSTNKKNRQAFLLGLATNLGVGNLIGVGAAIYYGGPGVIFWMALFAFFASSFAYSETKYALNAQEFICGETRSGTSFVIKKYFNNKIGLILSIIFAIFLLLTNSIFFPPIQIHSIIKCVNKDFQLILGISLFLFILFITNKGTKTILKFTDLIVPIMSIIYCVTIIVLIILKIDTLVDTLKLIISHALNFRSLVSSGILITIEYGISKSLFSHEAGLGTMPSLIGVAEKEEQNQMCSYQVLSVLIDTVLLCTLTGIFILQVTKGVFLCEVSTVLSYCFELLLGKIGLVICSVFIFTFGMASVVGQFYLGQTNSLFFTFLSKRHQNNLFHIIFKGLFYLGILLGIFLSFDRINKILDLGMICIGILNITVIFIIQWREKKHIKHLKNKS